MSSIEKMLSTKIDNLLFDDNGLSPELKRKLIVTTFSVAEDKMAKENSVAVVAPQYIFINEDALKNFVATKTITKRKYDEYPDSKEKDTQLTGFIVDLLKQSMGQEPDNINYKAKTVTHAEMLSMVPSDHVASFKKYAFKKEDFKAVEQYVKDGNLHFTGGLEDLLSNTNKHTKKTLLINIVQGEKYLTKLPSELKKFFATYDKVEDTQAQDYMIAGFASQVAANTRNLPRYLATKVWTAISHLSGLDKEDIPASVTRGYANEMSNNMREKIAHYANMIIKNDHREALISGITGFSMHNHPQNKFEINEPTQSKTLKP